MSDEVLVRLVRQFVEEGHNKGNVRALEHVFAEDAIGHGALSTRAPGREGILQRVAALRAAFPDEHAVVDDMVVQGDRVAFRWTITETHRGPSQGVAPTGRQIAFTGTETGGSRNTRAAPICWG
jgi:predicted ester cyclase